METISRSQSLYGPYTANPSNPILSNANTTEYCSSPLPHARHPLTLPQSKPSATPTSSKTRKTNGGASR